MKIHFLLFLILIFTLFAIGQTNDNFALGNPSRAVSDINQPNNYLVTHNGFVLSYNRSRGSANWVAWHLDHNDVGAAERTNAFAPDVTLPRNWWIRPTDYTGSGYDRGHLCPSKDRSSSEQPNRATSLMSNMQPQASKLNQKTWKYLEDYTRETVKNNEVYVYPGCYGDAGRIKNKITIPTHCRKIVVLIPIGNNDLKRISRQTRIIAVNMPNDESVSSRWRTYLTTIDDIEKKTEYDFPTSVPKKIQAVIEAAKDKESSASDVKSAAVKPAGKAGALKKNAGSRIYITGPGVTLVFKLGRFSFPPTRLVKSKWKLPLP